MKKFNSKFLNFLAISISVLLFSANIFAQQNSLFDYDSAAEPGFEEKSIVKNNKVEIKEILYNSPKDGKVTAFLVKPKTKIKVKVPAVIYLHGAGADKNQFLNEAVYLAEKFNFISLLIDSPAARPAPWKKSEYAYIEADRDMRIQAVVDIRRAVDLLSSFEETDKQKLAFVGFSYGASIGGILAGVEKRIKTFVLQASGGSPIDFWRNPDNPEAQNLKKILNPQQFEKFVESLKLVEQIDYIKNSSAEIFFQFAENDEFAKRGDFEKFYRAAPKPKKVSWYQSTHALNEKATADRINFLKKKLASKTK